MKRRNLERLTKLGINAAVAIPLITSFGTGVYSGFNGTNPETIKNYYGVILPVVGASVGTITGGIISASLAIEDNSGFFVEDLAETAARSFTGVVLGAGIGGFGLGIPALSGYFVGALAKDILNKL